MRFPVGGTLAIPAAIAIPAISQRATPWYGCMDYQTLSLHITSVLSLSLSLSNPFTSSLPQIIMPFRNAPIQLKETSDGVDITDLEGSAIGQMLEGGLKADQVVDIIQESVVSGLMRRGRCRRGRN